MHNVFHYFVTKAMMVAISVAILLSILSPLGVAAATQIPPQPKGPFNITVSPYSQDLVVRPGASVNVSFLIKNNNTENEQLKVELMTFKPNGTSGVPQLVDPSITDDFVKWVNMPTKNFLVPANDWAEFKATINAPKTAAFGYYYAFVFSRAQLPSVKSGSAIFGNVVGTVLLDVQAPGEKRQAQLTEFSTTNRVSEFLPVSFNILMKNTGNVHVAPRGNVFIYKGKKMIGLVQVNEALGNILPNSDRKYTADWSDGSPYYHVKRTGATKNPKDADPTILDWNNFKMEKLRYGKYTAKLQMIYNNGQYDVPNSATVSFWVIPWRIIFGILLVILFVLAGVWAIFIRPIRSRITQRRGGNGKSRR